ncbi:hypothetical protein [Cytobacillus oceanisediminis]|uniref:hypothetical protein n=1 Tax=Cytobacillus oceanisediminis TaxID=665099 RepID=UPI0015E84E4E|nr:hypothetical protein [Cytobacillus oceanisediminis]
MQIKDTALANYCCLLVCCLFCMKTDSIDLTVLMENGWVLLVFVGLEDVLAAD